MDESLLPEKFASHDGLESVARFYLSLRQQYRTRFMVTHQLPQRWGISGSVSVWGSGLRRVTPATSAQETVCDDDDGQRNRRRKESKGEIINANGGRD
jgi:hypothetical protein